MNIHNTNYVGATGLYPQVDETVTENIIFTSNDLIRLIGNTSNNLIGYDVYNSNALANYIQYTSNALANYIVYTSNDIITSLPMSPDTYQPTVDVPPFHIPQNWDKNDFFNAGALALMNNSTFHYWRNDFNSISGDIRQHIKLLQEAIEAHEYRFCENDISAWNWELYNNALSLNRDERMRTIEAWLLGLTGASAFNLSRTLDNTLSSLLTKTDSNNSSKSLSLNLLNDDIFYIFAYPIANNTITSNFGSTQYNGILYNPNNQITSISSSHFDKSYNYINSAIPNNYISISNNILGYRMITWMNAFSISVNIKLTAYTSSIQFIKAYNNSYTFIDIGYETLSSQTYIYFKLRSYNGTILCNYSINYNMVLNTWYNISVIYHNTVSFSIYANNVNIYAEQISYVPLVWDGIVDINSLKLELFYNCRNLNVEYFRLIPRALSSVEVEKIYNVYGSIASIDEIDINQSNYVLSISNRLTDTSNLISNRLTDTSNLISNRLTDTSNLISNRLTDTSNLISNRITQQFLDLNNEINSAWNSNITGVVYNLDDKIGIGTDTLDDTTKLKVIGNTDIQGSLNIYDGGFFVNHNNNNTIPAYSSIQNFLDNYGIIDRFYVVKHNGLYDYRNNQFYNPQSDQINIIYSNEMGKYVSRLYNNPKSGFFQPHDLGGFASNRWAIAMNIKLNDNLKEFTICDIYNVSALYATIRAKADFTLNRIVLYLYTTKTLGQPMELQHSAYIKVNDAKAQHFYVFNIYGFQYSFYVDGVNVLTKNDAQIVLGVYTKVWIGNDYGSHTGSYDYSDVIICDGHNIEPVSVMIDMMNYINTLPQKPDNKIFGKTYIEYIVNEQLRLGEYNLVVSSTTTNTNRKMLQIDNDLVENDVQIINSVNNMINNTNNSGFLRYANNSIETAPTLIQQIDYNNDITNKPIIPSSTTQIAEGNNLYYTPYRVGVIASASNLHTSNYVLNSSNDLINYVISKDLNVSNYVLTSSNSLINYVISKDINVSNYVLTSSNSLINYVISKDINVSNYVLTSSNSLINYAISKDVNVSNYVLTSSNSLINYAISKDINVSNYVLTSSNSLINYVISKDVNVSNYVLTSSNSLINYVISKDVNVSNYVLTSSNSLINYVISKDVNVSNYVLDTSNVISNRISSLGSSPWTVNGAVIYYNNGNVGIGTTFPTVGVRLQVEGTIKGWYFNGSGENLTTLNANNISSGTLTFARGGTGLSTIAANSLLGSGSSADTLQAITVGSGLTLSSGTLTANAVTSSWVYNGANGNIYYNPSIGPLNGTYNVGIGTTNPQYKLDVVGQIMSSSGVYCYNTNNSAGQSAIVQSRIGGTSADKAIFSFDVSGSYGWSIYAAGNDTTNKSLRFNNGFVGNGTDRLTLFQNGNVGIGTTNPQYKLDVVGQIMSSSGVYCYNNNNSAGQTAVVQSRIGGTSADKAIFSFDVAGSYGWSIYSAGNDTTNKSIRFNNGFLGNGTDILTLFQNGNVGIGLANPSTKLDVASGSWSPNLANVRWFNYNGVSTPYASATMNNICAAFRSDILVYSQVVTSSDNRIKKNIQDINDDTALQKILAIEPKTYNYIDEVERGSNLVYGFIAQQIREVIPHAVKLTSQVVPNIYKLCDCSSNIIYLDDISKLNINDKIDIMTETKAQTQYTITDVGSNYFVINEPSLDSTKCFVYGTEVDDFHTIDKSYIYTLNVCATQELYRIIERQGKEIERLSRICENLSAYVGFTI